MISTWLAALEQYVRANAVPLGGRVLVALLVLALAVLLNRVVLKALSATIAARTNDRRAQTLAPAVKSLTRAVILGGGLISALNQLGVNVTTVLAGAGVLGLAVGFGAQTLVRDVISGFFIIVDGVVETGDHVTMGTVSGTVEEVGLRITKIRSLDGRLWYVPNGELKLVGNDNRGWSRAMVVVPVPYEADLTKVLEVAQSVADRWASEHPELSIEAPEAQGVVGLTGEAVTIRVVAKVQPMQHWPTERALGRALKDALGEAGIEPGVPRRVIYHRNEAPQ